MLELRDLRRRYGKVIALDGLSFSARPGRLVGFLGPNGAGKTTAMRSIFGLVELEGGEVRWNGEPVDRSVRGAFGYMPEQRGLYPKMTCSTQLAYFARIHGMDEAAAQRNAAQWLDELGLAERADDTIEALSHGNQQRVQLAAALVHEPELLVLDEPFSGLDPLGVASMEDVLRREAERGRTIIFSSHQLDLVESLCDDVVIVHRGREVLSGTIDEIRSASEHRQLEVIFSEEGVSWVPPVDGVLDVTRRSERMSALVPAHHDVGTLLESARAAGEVRGFRWEPPSLADLFIEAVNGEVERTEVGV